jgi:hypothetical protein
MTELSLVQGSAAYFILAAVDRDGSTPSQLLSSDTLTAVVWAGQNQAALFSPTATWANVAAAQVAVAFTGSQTTALDYAGTYHMQVSVTRGTTTIVIIDCLLQILPSPGTGTDLVKPYCVLADLLQHAPWLTMLQDETSDQESYYSQRLEAKQWLDWLIVRSWRGTSAANFGDPGRAAQYWGGSWSRRSALPSQWLINQLSGGIVINPLTLTAQGSGYTFANVTFSGGGPNAFQATATAIVSGGQVISIQLIQAGYGYSSTPTITITGDGTGATATCSISANVLMLRPNVVRVCALKAASIVGLGQIGRTNSIAVFGALWRDMASAEVTTIVAELDLNGDGVADLPIPLIVTNTLLA